MFESLARNAGIPNRATDPHPESRSWSFPMPHDDRAFVSTRWSLVALAASEDPREAREALEKLCRDYWWPLYAYLRRRGLTCEDSADTVQGLFAEIIAKGRLAQADPNRGRFRSWLLSALKFHLSHERDRNAAQKRGGGREMVRIDEVDAERRWALLDHREQSPERLFERAWAIAVLERALRSLDTTYAEEGQSELLAALKPSLLFAPGPDDLRTIAVRLGMTVSAVKSAAFRLRKALRDAIRSEISSLLATDGKSTLDEEVRAMLAALSKN